MDQPPHGQTGRKRLPKGSGEHLVEDSERSEAAKSRGQPGTKAPTIRTNSHTTTRSSVRAGALHPLRDDAPDQGRCTRSEEVHCLRIGYSAPTHKNKRGTGKPSHPCPTTSPSTGHKADIGRVLSSFVAPSTHTEPAAHTVPATHTVPRTHKTAPASSHGDRGRGRGWLGRRARRAYSLTPPAVRPETMYFCKYWNSRMTGTAARTAPAAKMPHGAVRSSAAHMYMPTASVN